MSQKFINPLPEDIRTQILDTTLGTVHSEQSKVSTPELSPEHQSILKQFTDLNGGRIRDCEEEIEAVRGGYLPLLSASYDTPQQFLAALSYVQREALNYPFIKEALLDPFKKDLEDAASIAQSAIDLNGMIKGPFPPGRRPMQTASGLGA